ncbi:MAG TPA: NADH-quinone oxidoreductase subunit NuoE [Deltaproteobacteria bacterium]|jgi:NADH-quinone oxidoreductase E subunit|nr:NADH-quinone oxidoreductase subunit NuoE [Deltaproteobacteria bacterium]HOI05749.1 NADH-quinone oxidoreductase subunit NuoE [Deltaproteobacteria bacterium]
MKARNETRRPDGGAIVDPARQSMMLAALYVAQEQKGYLTKDAVRQVARRLGLTPGEVYSTASFYTLFRMEPVGRHVIQVCEGLSCYLNDGAERVVDYVSVKLGIQPGETTPDGRFTLETVQCLASCGTAPAMRVNDQLYENLTPASIDDILERLMGEV